MINRTMFGLILLQIQRNAKVVVFGFLKALEYWVECALHFVLLLELDKLHWYAYQEKR
jgi:hypothetical protein